MQIAPCVQLNGEKSMNEETHTMSDELIAHIAKLVQLAILTGTDIVDNLRMVEVVSSDTRQLSLSSEYREVSDSQIEKLLGELESAVEQPEDSGVSL